MANRNFDNRQALEKEVKDLYGKCTFGSLTAATIALATTTPVTLTKSTLGTVGNSGTFTLVIAAAAANPTDTILAVWTGTAAAITLTITPNDGTNNTATPVNVTSANLAQYLTSGTITAKTVTTTDSSSLAGTVASATGGNTTNLVHAGNGDGVSGTWSGATDALTNGSATGVASFTRNGVGDYSMTISDSYTSLKSFKAVRENTSAQDLNVQLYSETVASTKIIRFLFLTGATPTDPSSGTVALFKFECKNTSQI